LSLIGIIAALVIGWQVAAFAGPVGILSDFEDDDGNLTPHNQPTVDGTDWNSFAPPNYTGQSATGPLRNFRTTDETDADGWDFFGMLDEFKGSGLTNADSIYAGGTKQSDNCPTLVTKSAPNKDDLKRVYFSTKTLDNGHVILNLAWVRIPLVSTQSSAHVSFEFNQSDTPCPGSGHTDPAGRFLVPRTGDGPNGPLVDDLLVQYDFEGGATTPTISISRWTGSTWTDPDPLTSGEAEAAINQAALTNHTGDTPPGTDDRDALGPNGPEALGALEFGEAGIDLTQSGVFSEGECVQFGRVSASSRSSGNSNSSNMFDIAGPNEFSLENCGGIIIRKETDPTPDATDTTFNYTTTGGLLSGDPPANTFSLKDQEFIDFGTDVEAGTYSVTETDPGPQFTLTDINCDASDLTNGSTVDPDPATGTVDIVLEAQDQIDCTYTNTLQKGALAIAKNSTKGGAVSQPGAVFSYDDGTTTPVPTVTDNGTGDEDPDVGEVCVSGLNLDDYTVNEVSPPDGYGGAPATEADQLVTVVSGTDCDEPEVTDPPTPDPIPGPGVGATATFTNPPLADLQVNFRDGGSGETSVTSMSCDNTGTTADTTPATGWDDSVTHEDISIDPSPRTVVCTVVIDP
jgi:hypothetical protein